MMKDLLLNTEKEIDVAGGDFVTGNSVVQHQELLIFTNKGEWKENPVVAVGAIGFLKDEDEAGLLAEVKAQFQKDGMQVKSVKLENNNLNTDANY